MSSIYAELNEVADINWDSPKQVAPVLKSFGVSTMVMDKDTMQLKESVSKLALKDQGSHPIVEKYLKYKELKKSASSYGEKFLAHVGDDGRIHSSFHQIKDTGRTSSMAPNMQNIPRTEVFRRCFQGQGDNVLVIADFANQELRVLADKANEASMIDAFMHGRDIHLETAKKAFDNDELKKDSEERQMAKSMNFLMAYGGGASKLATQFSIPMGRAKALIKKYFEEFRSLEEYFYKTGEFAREHGYILIDDVIKRRSYIPEWEEYTYCEEHMRRTAATNKGPDPRIENRYRYLFSKIQRDSQNYPIQGTSANISKLAGILLRRKATETGLFKIVLLIHDEWVLECKPEDAQQVSKILEDCMLAAAGEFCRAIPIPAESKINKHWLK